MIEQIIIWSLTVAFVSLIWLAGSLFYLVYLLGKNKKRADALLKQLRFEEKQ